MIIGQFVSGFISWIGVGIVALVSIRGEIVIIVLWRPRDGVLYCDNLFDWPNDYYLFEAAERCAEPCCVIQVLFWL